MSRDQAELITVAVCTFRRALVAETLRSLAAQTLPDGVALQVLVADNDDHPGARDAIEALAAELGLALRYVHAPARNISIARNACLDHCDSEWLAFIDDDEFATPAWLAELWAARGGADFVFGPCDAVYPLSAPDWARAGDFHSTRLAGNDAAWKGYTGNVLMRMPFVRQHGLRFDPALGQVGGEDTLFFFAAHRADGRFAFALAALATEGVELRRLRLGWLLRRRFRAGQIHWLVLGLLGQRWRGGLGAGIKLAACLALALAGITQPHRWRANLLRAALHAGVIAAALGLPLYREYAQAQRP